MSLPVKEGKGAKNFNFNLKLWPMNLPFYVCVSSGLVDTHIYRLTACWLLAKSSQLVSLLCKESQVLLL